MSFYIKEKAKIYARNKMVLINKINFLFDSPHGVMYPKNSNEIFVPPVKNSIIAFN